MDIHSSISLYGSGQSPLTGQAALLEQSVFNAATGICETLMRLEVRRAMRPTRAIAENLRLQLDAENNIVQVNVELAKGSYLTSLLQHLILSD
jgi:tRNA(Glu) U13 pseudouridine synthase TruD